ncbi:MAG: homoaconitase [candidate division Zixibacteria bacterium]|nr:homoaconitase [candidate division Zixibacteria bacterium]MDD5427595.1 homoaconitase [candidate division Zixibacteria bacterium]
MGQNIIEKIAQKYAVGLDEGQKVRCGDYISIQPAYVMTHDNTGAVIPKFKAIGASCIAFSRQVVITLDHNVQDTSEKNLQKYANIEMFARENGVDFYPAGRGIGHQIMCEEGYAWPGTMVVASDSHSNMYGGLGCLGTPIVRTDAAAIWATGRTWWQVPPVARVVLNGKLRPGVTGKDVIISLCGFFNHDEVLNHAVEFAGDGLLSLSLNERLTIANMTTEWGALAGVFPVDNVTVVWLGARIEYIRKRGLAGVPSDEDGRGKHPRMNEKHLEELVTNRKSSDPDASYARELTLDLASVVPHVSGPDTVKVMTPITEIRKKKVKIDKAYLVSCVNSRKEDLVAAASVVKGLKVAKGVAFYIAAASSEVQAEVEKEGHWQTLIEAGAIPLPPGCGPCIGLGEGLLKDGEVGISATNRNFKGRMGSKNAQAYLASPEIVAASAITGYIDMPDFDEVATIKGSVKVFDEPSVTGDKIRIIEGFKEKVTGELIFCHKDNLNTDGIYPGKYTYLDEFTPQQQAEVVMENYDPEFKDIVNHGDILAGGFNFGTGSSREQAATALKYRGLQMVIAGSFNETYKRNALNNGFLAIEAPQLVIDLKEKFGDSKLTVKTGIIATIDFTRAVLTADDKEYKISPVGVAAQELIVVDGLENWVKNKIS